MFWKKIKSSEYLELKEQLASVKLDLKSLGLDIALILKKLKFKYKITKRDLKEDEEIDDIAKDFYSKVLLPE